MISYAQNFEDVLLARAFKGRTTGFYIDIGAMDPVDGSVTKHFYDLGWSGINIEPDPRFFEKLVVGRPRDISLNCALGAAEETRMFYHFEEQGISTFSPVFSNYFANRGCPFKTIPLRLTTLADICRKHGPSQIDFLKIDAEGWEGPIIQGADWLHYRPLILVIEATEPCSHTPNWQEWEPELMAANYTFCYFDGLNRFYLRNESKDELEGAFKFPPNVLDGFRLFGAVQAEKDPDRVVGENAELTARLDEFMREKEAEKLRADQLAEENTASRFRADQLAQENDTLRLKVNQLAEENAAAYLRLDQLAQEKLAARVWAGQLAQGKVAERFRAEGLAKELQSERHRADQSQLEKEAERHRADHLWHEKEDLRLLLESTWHEKEHFRLLAQQPARDQGS